MFPSLIITLKIILKGILIVGSSVSFSVSTTPPNGYPTFPAFPSLREGLDPIREWVLLAFAVKLYPAGRFLYHLASLNECLFILSSTMPNLGKLFPHLQKAQHDPAYISPSFLLGASVAILGGIGRFICFRTLGEAFTFECVRSGAQAKNPEVVNKPTLATSGPYSIVRHPSYTAGISSIIGSALIHLVEGSWIRESGSSETGVGKVLLSSWLFVFGLPIVFLLLRVEPEDEVMRKQFGEQWVQWSHRVRYKLVPGIY